jgi:hypothetical protein
VLFSLAEELGQAGVFAKEQRQNTGGHGIKRSKMPDGALASGTSHDGDHVMRGEAGRFIEYEKTVHAEAIVSHFSVQDGI